MPALHPAFIDPDQLLGYLWWTRGIIAAVGLLFFGRQAYKVAGRYQRGSLLIWACLIFVGGPAYIGLFIYFFLMNPILPGLGDGAKVTIFLGGFVLIGIAVFRGLTRPSAPVSPSDNQPKP